MYFKVLLFKDSKNTSKHLNSRKAQKTLTLVVIFHKDPAFLNIFVPLNSLGCCKLPKQPIFVWKKRVKSHCWGFKNKSERANASATPSADRSYRTKRDSFLLHLLLPQLQQQAAILLVERTGIRQEACGQENVSNQVFNLSLEASAAVSPTNLKQKSRTEMEGWWIDWGKRRRISLCLIEGESWPSLLPARLSEL